MHLVPVVRLGASMSSFYAGLIGFANPLGNLRLLGVRGIHFFYFFSGRAKHAHSFFFEFICFLLRSCNFGTEFLRYEYSQ